MVGQARVSIAYQHERTFDMGSLRRLAIWGGSAAVALLVAVLAGYSDASSRRLMAADAQTTGTPAAQLASRLPEIDAQTQRLAGVVDGLAAGRELLMGRMATLERNLEDVTGAIKRQGGDSSGQMSAVPPAPSPTAAVPAPAAADSLKEPIKEVVKEAPPPAPGSLPGPLSLLPAAQRSGGAEAQPAPPERVANISSARSDDPAAAEPPKIEFGVDVGGAVNFDGLRVLWASTRGSHGALLEGLHPVVAVRENSRTKNAELRLVVGPLANVEGAARLCASLSAGRRYCQPVAFEGQRLTEPDAVPERLASPRPAPAAAAPAPKPKAAAPAPRLPRLFP
jgi:hypothetical protein